MSRVLAGRRLPPAGSLREVIDLVGNLWDIECRHQLGKLSRAEYRQAVAAVRAAASHCPVLPGRRRNEA